MSHPNQQKINDVYVNQLDILSFTCNDLENVQKIENHRLCDKLKEEIEFRKNIEKEFKQFKKNVDASFVLKLKDVEKERNHDLMILEETQKSLEKAHVKKRTFQEEIEGIEESLKSDEERLVQLQQEMRVIVKKVKKSHQHFDKIRKKVEESNKEIKDYEENLNIMKDIVLKHDSKFHHFLISHHGYDITIQDVYELLKGK